MARIVITVLLSLHLLMPIAAFAQARGGKSPLDYSVREYALFLVVSIVGGAVSWWNKVRTGMIPATSVNHLIGELVTAGFSGLLTFWLGELAGAPLLLTAIMSGVMGHMGTRGIALFETWATRRFPVAPPAPPSPAPAPLD